MRRQPLKKLPRTNGVWEVGMVHAKYELDGKTTKGLLVVVERGAGAIRVAAPVMEGESPDELFRQAYHSPAPPAKPGRPKHVVFDDPWLSDQVANVLKEAGSLPVTNEATPALDDAIARLLNRAGVPAAPGIDADLMEWRAALQELIRLSPWKALDSKMIFSFTGGGLGSSVATMSGKQGELIGVVLYPRRVDLDSHRSIRALGQSGGYQHSAVHLLLEPRSGLSADELERCIRVALQFPPGLYPRVYAFTSKGLARARATEQARLLLAIRAITALCRAEPIALASGNARTLVLDGVQVTGSQN